MNWPSGDELQNGYVFLDSTSLQGRPINTMCPKTLWALGFMATCHQIRSETKNATMLAKNDINIHDVNFRYIEGQRPGIWRTVRLIRDISSTLGMRSGRVILWEDWSGPCGAKYERDLKIGLAPAKEIPGLDDSLSRYAQAIQPFQLFVGLSMSYQTMKSSGTVYICKRDAPVTLVDC